MHDWEQASDEDWELACRREAVLGPLAADPKAEPSDITDAAVALGLSRSRVYALLAAYRVRPQTSTLLPDRRGRRKGVRLLDAAVERIVEGCIREFYLTAERPSVTALHRRIRIDCRQTDLPVPSYRAVRRRIDLVDLKEQVRARQGNKVARDRFAPVGSGRREVKALELMQIDHTQVDVIVVDEAHRKPIGRPWLTLAIDVGTRVVAGMYLSLQPPSSLSVALALSHAVLPKEAYLTRLAIEAAWPVSGLPARLHVDNAREFHAAALERGVQEHGIALDFRPPANPAYGGHIERLIGTMMGTVHLLPGTTFSNTTARGHYDSEKNAVMTLGELEVWLIQQIVGVYHQTVHRALGLPPLQAWEKAVARMKVPVRHPRNRQQFQLDFLPFKRRKVRRDGIRMFNIHYWDNRISPLAGRVETLFIVKYDPRDLSRIYLRGSDGGYWPIPYRDLSRPAITLWEHRAACDRLREEGRQAVNEDAIFRTVEEQRALVASARAKTKAARRQAEQQARALNGVQATSRWPTSGSVPGAPDTEEAGEPIEPYPVEYWR